MLVYIYTRTHETVIHYIRGYNILHYITMLHLRLDVIGDNLEEPVGSSMCTFNKN